MSQTLDIRYIGKTTDEFVFGKRYTAFEVMDIEEDVNHPATIADVILSLEEKEEEPVINVWHVMNENRELVKMINANHLFALIQRPERYPLLQRSVNTILEWAVIKKSSDVLILPYNSENFIIFRIGKRYVDYSLNVSPCDYYADEKTILETIIEKCGISDWNETKPIQSAITVSLNRTLVGVRVQITPTKTGKHISLRLMPTRTFKKGDLPYD